MNRNRTVITDMLEHPIATMFIIGILGTTIVDIICAIKGVPTKPFIKINKIK